MKLRQLQCLCTVADVGFNISRAALALHATQPAISKQLRQLEEELGCDLLLRQAGRPVALSEAGERCLAWARRALQCTDNLRAAAHGDVGVGDFALAASHMHAKYLVLPKLASFIDRFPRVRVKMLQVSPEAVVDMVRDGRAVVGLTLMPPAASSEVVAFPFRGSPRVLLAPNGHPLLDGPELTLERIAAYPVVLPHSFGSHGGQIVTVFRDAGVRVDVALQALDTDLVKSYVAAGLGVGIISAACHRSGVDQGLAVRDASHLFEPALSAVVLRRHMHLPRHVHDFISQLDPGLADADFNTHADEAPAVAAALAR
ncbi:LysR substrate-binding domain-containing protein [Xylophilus sp. GOD-11R]|uniref:LysR substrate-binding domain-containing protein n=1 Tax=Xylophilus sp. GOD-11R TaxID=3089814 RepID=UPI00298CB707|nr:LysR substrate-binding domain-containing protein [Xylophilus sp. GOD-11R]WPB55909.1 LysR substrate-binding domain-containing protein [Xylophilus sp. GOD-11R]